MTAEAQEWLPEIALTAVEMVAPLARLLAEWSAIWMPSAKLSPGTAWYACGEAEFCMRSNHVPETTDFARLIPNANTNLELTSGMLDKSVEARDLRTANDRVVIDQLVARATADLSRRLEELLSAPRKAGSKAPLVASAYFLPVFLEGKEVLTIETDRSNLVMLAKRIAGTKRSRKRPSRRHEAILSQPVKISAMIGRNRLKLSDLGKLGKGDVITLRTNMDEPLDIAVGPNCVVRQAASIISNDDGFSIQIERPASQWQIVNP